MDEFEKYQDAIAESAKKIITPLLKKNKKELGAVFENFIFGFNGPSTIEPKLTAEESFFGKLFYGYTEILQSLEMLEDIVFFIGRYPFHKTRISRERYLRFNLEAWLSESYILQERLERYLKTIERLYRKDSNARNIKPVLKSIKETINQTFANVNDIRNRHIHQYRLKDNKLDRLDTIGLLANNWKEEEEEIRRLFKLLHISEYRKTRKFWKKQLNENNINIRLLFNNYFGKLSIIIFDKNTMALKYPDNFQGAVPCP
ncbi:hypothetical protein LLH00_13220 [bacterium]|nr:hypothetical protein [bacterium]